VIGLVRVTAPHFVAGVLMQDNICIAAAPILQWCVGKHAAWLSEYCSKKQWGAEWLGYDGETDG